MTREQKYEREIRRLLRTCYLPDDLDVRQAVYDIAEALDLEFTLSAWLTAKMGVSSPFEIEDEQDLLDAWHFVCTCATLAEKAAKDAGSATGNVAFDPRFLKPLSRDD